MSAPASSITQPPKSDVTAHPVTDTLANARASVARLRQMAQRIAATEVSPQQRLEVLEQLRTQAMHMLPEFRAHYIGRPQPLADEERQAWEELVGLWHAFYFGYALCGDTPEPALAAQAWKGALESLGRAIREHGSIYRPVPPILWKELHSCYRTAEACEVASVPVAPSDASNDAQTCLNAYVTTLLHDAAHFSALSGTQMLVVERWLERWIHEVDLTAALPEPAAHAPLAVHLDSDTGPRLVRELSADEYVRHIDTGRLGAKLRELSAFLRSDQPAPDLQMALQELPKSAVERLLTHLYVQWCSSGAGRREERQDDPARAQAAVTMHAIHFQISGRSFRQPGTRYTREEEHDLATFGHITERTEHRLLTGRSSALEPWEVFNQGASGSFGMVRKPGASSRIGHGQLIAVRTSSAKPPVLGSVQRLRAENDGTLVAGIRPVSSRVRGVAVRAATHPAGKFERALLIEADETRHLPQSLLLPRGQFVSGTLVELHDTRTEKAVLGEVLERGFDYERLACEKQ